MTSWRVSVVLAVVLLLGTAQAAYCDSFTINFETLPPLPAQPNNFFAAGPMQTYSQAAIFTISGGVVLGNPTFLPAFTTNGTLPNLYGTADFADPSLLPTITLDMLVARPTTMQLVDFVKVTSPMSKASPQTEANDKAENAVTFTSVSEKIRTIATWIPSSRQVLDDMSELAVFIDDSLRYYVDLEEELQLLTGDGTGENLHGLIPQAAAFDTSLLLPWSGWTRIDVVGAAVQQINEAREVDPTFIVLNNRDWWNIRRTKDSFGRYLLGQPSTPEGRRIWDLDVVPTQNMSAGSFLVGSGNSAAVEIRDRMELQIEVSTQHADFFVKNLIAVR